MRENKFYIKTTLTETINSLTSLTADEYDLVDEILKDIKNIRDKDSLLNFIFKEIFKENSQKNQDIIAYIMTQIFEPDFLKEKLWKVLKSRNYNDETQNKIIYILRNLGDNINFEDYIKYFDNPEAVIDKDTEQLLTNATINPESQIDFLDFMSTLSDNDWSLMLNSLSEDFDGNNLANILAPLVYVHFQNEKKLIKIIEMLTKTKSSLAFEPLENIIKFCIFDSCTKLAKKSIPMLKLMGKSINEAQKFYEKATENTEFHEAYTSYLDGHGNQCILYSRKAQNDTYQYFCTVIRDSKEIIDCFGFYELSENEYKNIIRKFIESQRLISVHENIVESFINKAFQYSIQNNIQIPYEICCWKNLISSKEKAFMLEDKLNETINTKFSNLQSKEELPEVFETWFFDEKDSFFNKTISLLIPTLKIEETIQIFYDSLKQNYQEFELKKKIIERLKIVAVLMSLCGNKDLLQIISILNNNTSYTYFEEFILKRSIYEYFLRQAENVNSNVITNIFTKKTNNENKKFNNIQIYSAIDYIEANW